MSDDTETTTVGRNVNAKILTLNDVSFGTLNGNHKANVSHGEIQIEENFSLKFSAFCFVRAGKKTFVQTML